MPQAKGKKKWNTKWLSILIKSIITCVAIIYVFYIIKEEYLTVGKDNFYKQLYNLNINGQSLYIVIMLMLINWGLEIIKWRYIVKKVEPISYADAIKGVLSGITVSIFTPKRIGEFAGRILYLDSSNRGKGVIATLIGSISQLLTTIIAGIAALLCYIFTNNIDILQFRLPNTLILLYSLTAVVLLLLLYLNTWIISDVLKRINLINRFSQYFEVFKWYTSKELLKVLLLSVLRYISFTIQFYLLLLIFGVEISLIDGFVRISITFLALASIPSTILSELGIRESVSVKLIGSLSSLKSPVIMASFGLWLINIALPAIIGSFFFITAKMFRNKQ